MDDFCYVIRDFGASIRRHGLISWRLHEPPEGTIGIQPGIDSSFDSDYSQNFGSPKQSCGAPNGFWWRQVQATRRQVELDSVTLALLEPDFFQTNGLICSPALWPPKAAGNFASTQLTFTWYRKRCLLHCKTVHLSAQGRLEYRFEFDPGDFSASYFTCQYKSGTIMEALSGIRHEISPLGAPRFWVAMKNSSPKCAQIWANSFGN